MKYLFLISIILLFACNTKESVEPKKIEELVEFEVQCKLISNYEQRMSVIVDYTLNDEVFSSKLRINSYHLPIIYKKTYEEVHLSITFQDITVRWPDSELSILISLNYKGKYQKVEYTVSEVLNNTLNFTIDNQSIIQE